MSRQIKIKFVLAARSLHIQTQSSVFFLAGEHYVTERENDRKTVVLWTIYYHNDRAPQELTSWRHCSNDIKGSCVFTFNRSKYEVWLLF